MKKKIKNFNCCYQLASGYTIDDVSLGLDILITFPGFLSL